MIERDVLVTLWNAVPFRVVPYWAAIKRVEAAAAAAAASAAADDDDLFLSSLLWVTSFPPPNRYAWCDAWCDSSVLSRNVISGLFLAERDGFIGLFFKFIEALP